MKQWGAEKRAQIKSSTASTDQSEGSDPRSPSSPRLFPLPKLPISPLRLLQLAVVVGLIILLVSRVGLGPVIQSFSGVIWWWIVAIILLTLFSLLLRSVRWHILLNVQGISLPKIDLFKRNWMADFASNFMPGQTGGDLFRVFAPWGTDVKKTAVGTSVVYDRLAGLAGLLFVTAIVGQVEHRVSRELGLGYLPILSILTGLILLALMTMPKPVVWSRTFTNRFPIEKAKSIAEGIQNTILAYANRKAITLAAIGISVAFHLVVATGTYFSFQALGIDIPLGSAILIALLINVITLVPITINGWGIREGAFIVLYTQIGIGSAEALSVAFLGRMISVLVSSGGAIFYLTPRIGR